MSLKSIIGQEKVISFLKSSIENNKLASSYLFIGPEGIGKTLVAKEFAKLINCQKNNLSVCDSCISCMKIEKDNHPDIHWIEKDDSGNIKIDTIRQLEKDISLKPFEAKTKVFVVKEAHTMTSEAANALLKTLEEPPKNSILVLTTSSAEKLFSTIVSRCQKVFFSSINRENLKSLLTDEYNLEEKISHYLSYSTEGRLGRALNLKEKDILGEKNRIINTFINAKGAREGHFDLDFKNKQDIRYNLDILINWFRDILLLKCGIEAKHLVNADRKEELIILKEKYKTNELLEIMHRILDTYTMLEYNLNPKIFLEFLRLKSWQR